MQNKTYCVIFFTFFCGIGVSSYYENISDDYLKSLLTPNGYYVDVVVPLRREKIVVVNATVLLYVHEQYYKSKYSTDFDFLKALYSGKIRCIDRYFNDYTKSNIDKLIMTEYREHGLKYIIEKYLRKDTNGSYIFNEWTNFTVVKIMFANNFYLYYDDYIPTYFFKLNLDNLAIPEDWN